jgi:hypothetical protein
MERLIAEYPVKVPISSIRRGPIIWLIIRSSIPCICPASMRGYSWVRWVSRFSLSRKGYSGVEWILAYSRSSLDFMEVIFYPDDKDNNHYFT